MVLKGNPWRGKPYYFDSLASLDTNFQIVLGNAVLVTNIDELANFRGFMTSSEDGIGTIAGGWCTGSVSLGGLTRL